MDTELPIDVKKGYNIVNKLDAKEVGYGWDEDLGMCIANEYKPQDNSSNYNGYTSMVKCVRVFYYTEGVTGASKDLYHPIVRLEDKVGNILDVYHDGSLDGFENPHRAWEKARFIASEAWGKLVKGHLPPEADVYRFRGNNTEEGRLWEIISVDKNIAIENLREIGVSKFYSVG